MTPSNLRVLRRCALATALSLVGLVGPGTASESSAGGTKKLKVRDYGDFDDGETEGAAIEKPGRVTVGYLPVRGDVPGTSAFSCLARGKEVWVGTADAATVQRIKIRKGKGKRPKKVKGKEQKSAPPSEVTVEEIAALEGVVVTAMAPLPNGDVVAATLPGGTLVRINKRGKVSEFAKLDVKQIWTLVPHRGRLLVGTGPKGELFSLGFDGKGAKVVLDVDEKHIMSVLPVEDTVLVGTSPRAKLYQLGDDAKGILVHDFKGDEIRAMVATKRDLLVAVNDFASGSVGSVESLTKKLNRASLAGTPAKGSIGSSSGVKADAALYRVDLGPKRDPARAAEAPWETWLARDKQYFTGLLAVDDEGTVLVSSSSAGKIYRVRSLRSVATVADLEERQATSLCKLSSGEVVATSGDGAGVYHLAAAPAAEAKYRTEIFDANHPASFGTVRLRGNGTLRLKARTGPGDDPDDRWTDWKEIALRVDANGRVGSLSDMLRRRYVQLEVGLGSRDAELRDIELFYAPENLAPLVRSVDIEPPEFDDKDDEEPKPKATIKWKVDARDDDDLIYEVRVRPEGGKDDQWIKLHDDKPLTKKRLDWDLSTVPDGTYEVEVVASDEPANGSAKAQFDELVSAPFVVDRKRPSVGDTKVSGLRVTGQASDNGSYIQAVAFSVDGGPFRAASPSDGLFDSDAERFEIQLPADLKAGTHRVVIRARDAAGNQTTTAIAITR